ncbi:hypothetical protein QQ020_07545 [Fulvivirgaceae bacterium BMA12]|uniref:Lipoprotein n=1 Tax=Agaribacillus aureus TaxID=3051825 RepID=A0ABT8L2C5_9BACT|nr:hypothetical protein [Fulvivirgaceae bacterium BMA12]
MIIELKYYRKITPILIVLFSTACGNSKIPDDVKWEITKEEPNNAFSKDNLEIKLNKKVDETTLKEIALELRKDRKQYDNLWIFYRIPNMTNGLAWATTHFTPDLRVEIIGSTAADDIETSKTTDIDGKILGKWRSEKSLMGAALILFKDSGNKLKMRIVFKDGEKMESKIMESKQEGQIRYDDDNEYGEYYILEANGNLGMYGKDGKFDEAIKIE